MTHYIGHYICITYKFRITQTIMEIYHIYIIF